MVAGLKEMETHFLPYRLMKLYELQCGTQIGKLSGKYL